MENDCDKPFNDISSNYTLIYENIESKSLKIAEIVENSKYVKWEK